MVHNFAFQLQMIDRGYTRTRMDGTRVASKLATVVSLWRLGVQRVIYGNASFFKGNRGRSG